MLKYWHKFRGWVVLEHFLKHPNEKIHVNELARQVSVSTQSARQYLSLYEKDKLLLKEKVGNLIRYSLNNYSEVVKALKKFYFLQKLNESGFLDELNETSGLISLVLYGSHANGTYAGKSDIDLLAISQNKKLKLNLAKLENEFMKEAGLTTYTIGEWRALVKKKDNFTLSVLKNHVVLFGGAL